MNDEQQSNIDPQEPPAMQPDSPPTIAAPLQAKKTSWPTVVGVIGIIYAGLGLLGNVCGVVVLAFAPQFIEWLQNMGMSDEDAEDMAASLSFSTWMVLGGLIGLALTIMLLLGSIKLYKRRQSGAKLCKLWAWITIPWVFISTTIGFVLQTSISESSTAAEQIGALIGAIAGTLFALILPIYLVIWLSRSKIKSEVASWSD